jgi:cullin 3
VGDRTLSAPSTSATTANELVPCQVGVQSEEVDFEKTWSGLESSFREIHTKNASNLSYEELYRGAYRIVLRKKGEELYNRVISFEGEWLKNTVQHEVKRLISSELMTTLGSTSMNAAERRVAGEKFLKGIKQQWQDQHVCMAMLADVLMYLVRLSSGSAMSNGLNKP